MSKTKVIQGVEVIDEDRFWWTQEFEDAKGERVEDKKIDFNWSIVEYADGSKYLKNNVGWIMLYPIVSDANVIIDTDEPALPIGSHPDWEDYKADHIVGSEDEWDEEGEWNVFCADRELV